MGWLLQGGRGTRGSAPAACKHARLTLRGSLALQGTIGVAGHSQVRLSLWAVAAPLSSGRASLVGRQRLHAAAAAAAQGGQAGGRAGLQRGTGVDTGTVGGHCGSAVQHERLEAGDGAGAGGAAGGGGAVPLNARVAVEEVQAGQHHAVALDLQQERGWGRGRGCGGRMGGKEARAGWPAVAEAMRSSHAVGLVTPDVRLAAARRPCAVAARSTHQPEGFPATHTLSRPHHPTCAPRSTPLIPHMPKGGATPRGGCSPCGKSCTAALPESLGTCPPAAAPAAAGPPAPGERGREGGGGGVCGRHGEGVGPAPETARPPRSRRLQAASDWHRKHRRFLPCPPFLPCPRASHRLCPPCLRSWPCQRSGCVRAPAAATAWTTGRGDEGSAPGWRRTAGASCPAAGSAARWPSASGRRAPPARSSAAA